MSTRRTTGTTLRDVECGVRRDREEPGPYGTASSNRARFRYARRSVLHRVIGIIDQSEYSVAMRVSFAAVRFNQFAVRALVTSPDRFQNDFFIEC